VKRFNKLCEDESFRHLPSSAKGKQRVTINLKIRGVDQGELIDTVTTEVATLVNVFSTVQKENELDARLV